MPGKHRTSDALRLIWQSMSLVRRRHFFGTIVVMLLGSIAELLTIGSVLPFLALVAAPETAQDLPMLRLIASELGSTDPRALLIASATILICAAIAAVTVRLWLMRTSLKFVLLVSHEMALVVFARMLRQPYWYYVTRNSSEVLASQEKIQAVIWSVLHPGMQAATSAAIALTVIALLFAIDPFSAAFAAATLISCYLLMSFAVRRRLQRNSERFAWAATQRLLAIQEGLGGIRDILLEQSQEVFEAKFRRLDLAYREAQVANNFIIAAPRFVVEAAGIALLALLTVFLLDRSGSLEATIPVLGALAVGAQRLLPLLQQSYQGWSSFAGNQEMLFDVVDLMTAPIVLSAPRDRNGPPRQFQREIALEHVSFCYGGREHVLRDVDLVISKGERIGIMGETGSGKSTLSDILMGLLDPSSGQVLIDGSPLNDSNRANWQAQVAHVPQTIFLSDSTVAANIAFGEPEDQFDFERVRDAAMRANVDEFISTLPEGYLTCVGERGIRLSGGQRQRIGIARALYKRASVLILDEATSAVDNSTETAIMRSILSLEPDLTIIMIAHRTTTLAECDRVLRLSKGRVVGLGTYAELIGSVPREGRKGPTMQ